MSNLGARLRKLEIDQASSESILVWRNDDETDDAFDAKAKKQIQQRGLPADTEVVAIGWMSSEAEKTL